MLRPSRARGQAMVEFVVIGAHDASDNGSNRKSPSAVTTVQNGNVSRCN